MKKRSEKRGTETGAARRILTGAGISAALLTVFLGIFAALIQTGRVGEGLMAQAVTAAACLSVFCGAMAAVGKGGGKRPIYGLAVAGAVIMVRMAASAFASAGSLFDPADMGILGALIFAGTAAAILRAGKKKRRRV